MGELLSVKNEEDQLIPKNSFEGVVLSLSKKLSLLILAVSVMNLSSGEAVADELAGTRSAIDLVLKEGEKLFMMPGKLHEIYLNKIESIDASLDDDINFLKESKLSAIRYNPQLFYPKLKDGEESMEQQMANLKNETARRLRAYTNRDKDWFTLDFGKMGSDKKVRLPHEYNIQLGDILVDTDVRSVMIQRVDGTILKAIRGVCGQGGYSGRVGFMDVNGQFVPVFSGDKFRILSDEEGQKTYFELLDLENRYRAEHKKSYQTQRGSAATFMSKEGALRAAKKITFDPFKIKIPNEKEIKDAEKECRRDENGNATKNYYLVLGKENFMEIVKYCAAEVGVPIELILTTIKKESGFILGIIGDHGKAIGLGQLHESRWKYIRNKPKFVEIMQRFTDKTVAKMKRSESVLVDVLAVAMVLKSDLVANNIEADYQTRLEFRQIANVRFHYHVPGIFNGKNRARGFNKWKAGYFRYAEEVLKVRRVLDETALEGIDKESRPIM